MREVCGGENASPRALRCPSWTPDTEIEKAAGKSIKDIFCRPWRAILPRWRAPRHRPPARQRSGRDRNRRRSFHDARRAREHQGARRFSWLRAEFALLLRRVQRRTHRPMLVADPEGTLRRLMDARYETYANGRRDGRSARRAA